MSEKLFETATRNKYLFQFKGQITVTDLWDLNVKELDSIYKTLNKQLKLATEDSLLQVKNTEDTELTNKIEIIKYIVSVKQTEDENRLKEKEVKEKKQKILEILAKKKDDSLNNMSEADLEKMLNELS